MKFGSRIRGLRMAKGMTLRELSPLVGVGYSYLSRIENERLNYGDYPSNTLITKLAEALDADESELLLLAGRVPQPILQRLCE